MKTTITKLMLLAMLCMGINAKAQNEFITRWNLATSGSAATTLTLGLSMSGPVNYTWTTVPAGVSGTGTFATTASQITGLPAGAIVSVSLDPTNINSMSMGSSFLDRDRLIDVEQWGSAAWTTMTNMFADASNLQISASDVPNLSGVTVTTSMFRGCSSLNSPANINSWDMSSITNAAGMFSGAVAFNQDISGWNISQVSNMSAMFYGASSFNQDISAWDITNVASMASMFEGASSFNQNISNWNIRNVTDMTSMFSGASSFNQNMSTWATHLDSDVVMTGCFDHTAISIANYDAILIAFNTYAPSGITIGAAGLRYCSAAPARDHMLSTKTWTVNGDTPGPNFAIPAFASVGPVCPGASLPAVSDNGISGTWSPATIGTSVSTYTFIPAFGECAPTVTLAVTMGAPVTPAFSVPATLCSATTMAALPHTSTNGINGTWAPAFNHVASMNYTFTPNVGQCASTTTLAVHIIAATTPIFNTRTPACAGTILATLPSTSNNGVTGTWLPALNNTITTTYTFTPDSGQCAYISGLAQVIKQLSVPTFTTFTSSCGGVVLPTTADNGLTGKWMPSVTFANASTYTFTPDPGQCSSVPSVTAAVSVYSPVSTTVLNGGTITANETGATYQWVDCNNGKAPIANATNASYTPSASGSYAVIVTKNGCSATSPCQQVSLTTGIYSQEKNSMAITLSPNPSQGVFQISTTEEKLGTVLIYNSLGELVYSTEVKDNAITIDLSNVTAGIYVVQTIAHQKATSQRIIIGH